ncbi:MAG: ADP-ribosylglycohydrolase family protein [Butyrivibrio sp.]|nr:ADP-ribosylglycohydrolase family protein [Butyrivibrio sp.]
MDKIDIIRSGIFGVVVGDALGVPVEFSSRAERRADPVTDMRGYGTHSQPKGTWSDDSSMMLATMDSIIRCKGIDYVDMMERFGKWRVHGEYTPYGSVFDIGITCANAIARFQQGSDPLKCGGVGERDNGNGSLMRIMPASLFVILNKCMWETAIDEAAGIIENVSRLTHGHLRSRMACVIYTAICYELIAGQKRSLIEVLLRAVDSSFAYYEGKGLAETSGELMKYGRLRDIERFKGLSDEEIGSSGYVVDTLEAAVWCLLNSGSYAECVLKAVNLGDDTDTVAAVAGGLAGLWYGYDGIPGQWREAIASREWIEDLCGEFGIGEFDRE